MATIVVENFGKIIAGFKHEFSDGSKKINQWLFKFLVKKITFINCIKKTQKYKNGR